MYLKSPTSPCPTYAKSVCVVEVVVCEERRAVLAQSCYLVHTPGVVRTVVVGYEKTRRSCLGRVCVGFLRGCTTGNTTIQHVWKSVCWAEIVACKDPSSPYLFLIHSVVSTTISMRRCFLNSTPGCFRSPTFLVFTSFN